MTLKASNAKVLIYGHEIGGQMELLAETLRRRWIQTTAVACNADFRGYQNDINVAGASLRDRLGRFMFSVWAFIHYDVFHFFWGVSFWGIWRFHLLDLPILKFLGKRVVVHFRGLDAVDIKYFDYKRDLARGENVVEPPTSRPDQKKKIAKWRKYADSILISEPDLFFVSPDAILSPQVIDLSYWQGDWRPKSKLDGIIRIVHAPSSRRKKGTDFIEDAIEELKSQGLPVEIVLAENLAHDKVKELYSICDIGIDQVLYGWHGKVSVEMMAMGLPTVCHIDEKYLEYRADLPIVNANPTDLVGTLKGLIMDEGRRDALSDSSKRYVAKHHDVEMIVDELATIYGLDSKSAHQVNIVDAKTW